MLVMLTYMFRYFSKVLVVLLIFWGYFHSCFVRFVSFSHVLDIVAKHAYFQVTVSKKLHTAAEDLYMATEDRARPWGHTPGGGWGVAGPAPLGTDPGPVLCDHVLAMSGPVPLDC